jgi:hypothetical protein
MKTITEKIFVELCKTLDKYDKLPTYLYKKNMYLELYQLLCEIYNEWEDNITKGR